MAKAERNAEICARVAAGEKPIEVAMEYGLSRVRIYQIVKAGKVDGTPRGRSADSNPQPTNGIEAVSPSAAQSEPTPVVASSPEINPHAADWGVVTEDSPPTEDEA